MPPEFVQGNISGISYGFIETSSTSDRILIFLPGIGAYKENYVDHILAFTPYYSKLFILDLPEQGSRGCWQIGVMVEQLAEFIRSIDSPGINRIDLAGHSAGALAAISFVANYNTLLEQRLSEAVTSINSRTAITSMPSLEGTGFATRFHETEKVSRLLLYAPPDSFDHVFDRLYSIGLSGKSEQFVRNMLNIVVNRSMLFLRLFGSSPYFSFRLDRSDKPQYFRLIINDHIRFLKYTSEYLTLFEVFQFMDKTDRDKLATILSEKRILVQYGSSDWIVKPFKKRVRSFVENIKIADSIKLERHKFLGHMLNHRFRPDINMNAQMVTNPEVISESIDFINQ